MFFSLNELACAYGWEAGQTTFTPSLFSSEKQGFFNVGDS